MTEHQEQSEGTPDEATSYEAPLVEDLESADGPAVTAAGLTAK